MKIEINYFKIKVQDLKYVRIKCRNNKPFLKASITQIGKCAAAVILYKVKIQIRNVIQNIKYGKENRRKN